MDTPSFPPPRDATEQDILDNLVAIRDKLQLLKHNRKTYMQKQDIIPLYQDTIEQVRRLTEARPQDQVLEKNRVDRVLDSCFLLLSLSFMTIGQNNTAPAAYALTVTTERLLDHLAEVDLFSAKDLESIEETLTTLTRNVKNAAAEQSPYLVTLLLNRLDSCKKSLVKLQKRLEKYEKPLPKVHETLISILRSISWANTRSKFSASEVKKLRKQLTDIEQDIKDGKYKKEDGEWPSGSVEVDNLLRKCLLWADIVLDRAGEIPDSFKPLYSRLLRIKNDLDKLSITGRWALREADLYDYTRELDSIDEQRVNGNWVDEDGREAELYVQRTMLYLVRRSYGYVYFLMLSSKPVSEALLPIFNQLQTLKTCLVEVKNSGGVSSVRELYPYSMKLHSIDNLRVDGKFIFNGDIPEGQGSVNELLAECFELNYDLRVAAESNAGDEDDAEDDATPGDATTPEVETDALANTLSESRLDAAPTTDTPTKA